MTIHVQGIFIIFQEFKEGVFQVNYYFLILSGHGCMSHKGYKINTTIWFDNASSYLSHVTTPKCLMFQAIQNYI